MAGPIRHEFNQTLVRSTLRTTIIHDLANRVHNINICPLRSAPDTIGLSRHSILRHHQKRDGMVFRVQPITHIHTAPIDRQFFTGKAFQDHQGDELLGKLSWPIIV